jgi:hypothetical protein
MPMLTYARSRVPTEIDTHTRARTHTHNLSVSLPCTHARTCTCAEVAGVCDDVRTQACVLVFVCLQVCVCACFCVHVSLCASCASEHTCVNAMYSARCCHAAAIRCSSGAAFFTACWIQRGDCQFERTSQYAAAHAGMHGFFVVSKQGVSKGSFIICTYVLAQA